MIYACYAFKNEYSCMTIYPSHANSGNTCNGCKLFVKFFKLCWIFNSLPLQALHSFKWELRIATYSASHANLVIVTGINSVLHLHCICTAFECPPTKYFTIPLVHCILCVSMRMVVTQL